MFRAVCGVTLVLVVSIGVVAAQEAQKPSRTGKAARMKPDAVTTGKTAAEAPALPCPRATWKDDPVCFGEGDKDALPMPSGPAAPSERAADGLRIKPTTRLNPRPGGPGGAAYQSEIIYQSNGNAVTNNYGGGVKLEMPF
jgi:hypothetical protein